MVTIRCQNKTLQGKNGICGRILAIVSDAMMDLLRLDTDGGLVHRCPQCPPEQRWSRITSDSKGNLKFETIDQPTEMPPEAEFKELEIFTQVG